MWNGPAGYFENPNFANGSYEIAKTILEKNKNRSIFSVVGGGDTIAVINQINAIKGIELKNKFPNAQFRDSIKEALTKLNLEENDIVLITGSFYLAGEVLNLN